jgi:hypothetical protein
MRDLRLRATTTSAKHSQVDLHECRKDALYVQDDPTGKIYLPPDLVIIVPVAQRVEDFLLFQRPEKIYLDDAEKGPAQRRFENERNAYRLSAEFAWRHVLQYYGEVRWKLASRETECFGVALQFFGGEPLSKSLVAKMSADDRDKLTRRVYRLMRQMAKVGLSIGDIDRSC